MQLGMYKDNLNAMLPEFSTHEAACFDLRACLAGVDTVKVWGATPDVTKRKVVNNTVKVFAGERALIPTGLIFDIPRGHSVRVHPRSGLALKSGIALCNMEGVIDSDYIDPTFITLWNTNPNKEYSVFEVRHGDRLAQAEMIQDLKYELVLIDDAPTTYSNRTGGFGSTGV